MSNNSIESGRIALLHKWISPEQLSKCMSIHKEVLRKDVNISLSDILLKEGYINLEQKNILEATVNVDSRLLSTKETNIAQKQFGRYIIKQEIGRGGMGKVYEAWDPKLERAVALKVLLGKGEIEEKRFLREAKATAKLNHPHIVPVYDIGKEQDEPFFTMDYIDGAPLGDTKKLSLRQKIDIMIKICHAIDYAHQNGIIHRDLKPANIMIDSSLEPKIMDFGLAKLQGAESLSQSGSLLGTIYYMPIEQAEGKLREVDCRSDTYSLGVIFYQLLTGKMPFVGKSFVQVVEQIKKNRPEAPSLVKRSIDKSLESICLKAISKAKQDRYQTAKEMATDLEKYQKGEKPNIRKYSEKKILMICIVLVISVTSITLLTNLLHKYSSKETMETEIKQIVQIEETDSEPIKSSTEEISEEVQNKIIPQQKQSFVFPSSPPFPIVSIHSQMRDIRRNYTKLDEFYEKNKKIQYNELAIKVADDYYKIGQIQYEINVLQKVFDKPAEIYYRLGKSSLDAKLYCHANYYFEKLSQKYPTHVLLESLMEEKRKVDLGLSFSKEISPIRKTVQKIYRSFTHARLRQLEEDYSACVECFGFAESYAENGAHLFSIKNDVEMSDNKVLTTLKEKFVSNNYPLSATANIKQTTANSWQVDDEWEMQYIIQKRDNNFEIYAPLTEFLPLIRSYQLIANILNNNSIEAKKYNDYFIATNNTNTAKSKWYPLLSHYFFGDKYLPFWPEQYFAQGIYYFFTNEYEKANEYFMELKQYYAWYPSGEKQFIVIVDNYIGNKIEENRDIWIKKLSNNLTTLHLVLLVRGIMCGKNFGQKNDYKTYGQIFEDILNLEESAYMVNNHLGDIYHTFNEDEKAFNAYVTSYRLIAQDIIYFRLGQFALKYNNWNMAKQYFLYSKKHPPEGSNEQITTYIEQVLQKLQSQK